MSAGAHSFSSALMRKKAKASDWAENTLMGHTADGGTCCQSRGGLIHRLDLFSRLCGMLAPPPLFFLKRLSQLVKLQTKGSSIQSNNAEGIAKEGHSEKLDQSGKHG